MGISKKLKDLFLLNILLLIVHGIEEASSGFYKVDPIIAYFSGLFINIPHAFYWTFHVTLWFMLIMVYLVLLENKWKLLPFTLFTLVYVIELNHFIEAIFTGNYYPGLITSFLFPILGYYYCRELIKNWREN